MKYSEFVRWLKSHGAEISQGKGRHYLKATYNGRTVPVPYHGAKEIPEGVRKSILKQLGLSC
ncbi:MAG TPA: type II toxin-antitoxin system HicA family toxin [Plasticicumulans sp.]|nr:type II toxin-antitoxin system HicA family toxin [Plasticicumulans sp.]